VATSTVRIEVDGLREARAAVKKAGGSLDDLEKVNRDAAEVIQKDAVKRAPRRSGKLARHVEVEASPTTGKVVGQATVLPYFGPVHFGWVTRNATKGLSRKTSQQALGGVLTRSTINKAARQTKNRTMFKRDTRFSGVREVVGRKKAVRGGPIKPQPFLYAAADARVDEVFLRYEKAADEIERALSWQKGIF
jgi:hypothetical protein